MRTSHAISLCPMVLALIVGLVACAGEDEAATSTTTESAATSSTASTSSTPSSTTTDTTTSSTFITTTTATTTVEPSTTTTTTNTTVEPSTTTTTTNTTTTTTSTTTTTTLPGTPVEPLYTPAGAELAAVAIPYDETFDVRVLPGTSQPIVVSLPPLATGIVSTGQARSLGVGDTWLEVNAAGGTGWVPLFDLLYIATPRDATARYVGLLGGAPTAPTMQELGLLVADAVASHDPEVTSRVVVVVEPTEGPTGEVTVDVVDFPDDSVGGVRLRIVGQQVQGPTSPGPEPAYELVSVEATGLCYRGVSGDLCV